MRHYFEIRYNVALLLITILGLPFFLAGTVALLDLIKEGLAVLLNGGNPFMVLSPEYTKNKLGLSKSLLLDCWPMLMSTLLCFRMWAKPNSGRNYVFFGIFSVASYALPVAAVLAGYTIRSWVVLLSLIVCLIIFKIISKNQNCKANPDPCLTEK